MISVRCPGSRARSISPWGAPHDALGKFVDNPGDSAQLKFARTHLHQAHGALSIVGLDGVTQFSEAIEQLLSDIEGGQVAATAALGELAQRAIAVIRHYLDEVASGMPNQPLKFLGSIVICSRRVAPSVWRQATCSFPTSPCARPNGRMSRCSCPPPKRPAT
ncbi:MAG: Hpt domain-containing protein [Rhodocyclaceae bacterium]|nr:Hpt domain-containing protein [Rhodocyclaceae bacterium]